MNSKDQQAHRCPHCGSKLLRWQTPIDSTWGGAIRLVCFNDECSYYVRGWEVMMEQQHVSCSYRYLLDPETGYSGPVPVWSRDALRDGILND